MKKKLLVALLSLAMALSFTMASAFAVGKPTVTVETAAEAVDVGTTVVLRVSIKDNPGFTNFEWNIRYDKARLELKAIDGEPDFVLNPNHPQTGFGYASCARANSYAKDTDLFTLTFTVKADAAAGNAEVTIESNNFKDNGKAIDAGYVPGGVTVNGTTAGGSTTGGSTTGGSTTGGSTTGGSTTGGSTTGGSTTGGSTTGGDTTVDYKIIEGANGAWTQNSDGTLTFRANGEFSKFTGVKVDGKLIDAKCYTAKSGSTIVTLNNEYLPTLSVGTHTLTVVFEDGECSTDFTVKAAGDNTNPGDNTKPGETVTPGNNADGPQTGDHSSIVLAVAVLLVSGGALTVLAIAKKKAGKC